MVVRKLLSTILVLGGKDFGKTLSFLKITCNQNNINSLMAETVGVEPASAFDA